jgi:XTP/dITP diphosphohydrolase
MMLFKRITSMCTELKDSTILIATSNLGKQKEIRNYLKDFDINLLFLSDLEKKVAEPVEDADSFLGNALIKAKYYNKIFGYPTLADDSGLCVDGLEGLPGIYSARWAGPKQEYTLAAKKIKAMLKEKDVSENMPTAKFVCCLVLFWNDDHYKDYYGEVKGKLDFSAKGHNGFGYDPIFIPEKYDITFAQMEEKEKQRLSHRGKAFKSLIADQFFVGS